MAQINQHLNTRKYLSALVGHARGIVMSYIYEEMARKVAAMAPEAMAARASARAGRVVPQRAWPRPRGQELSAWPKGVIL